jgi:hypothetical protein
VPDTAIPDAPTQTTVPARVFGHPGTLAVRAGHDLSATYAILYGPEDLPVDWLRAGQALSAATEVPATRQVVRQLLSGLGQP